MKGRTGNAMKRKCFKIELLNFRLQEDDSILKLKKKTESTSQSFYHINFWCCYFRWRVLFFSRFFFKLFIFWVVLWSSLIFHHHYRYFWIRFSFHHAFFLPSKPPSWIHLIKDYCKALIFSNVSSRVSLLECQTVVSFRETSSRSAAQNKILFQFWRVNIEEKAAWDGRKWNK